MHNIKRQRLTKKNRLSRKKKTGGWQPKKTTPNKTKKILHKPKSKITIQKPSTSPSKKLKKKK